MEQNVIKVSAMNEVQVLNLMKNVAECLTQLNLNFEFEDTDRRHAVVAQIEQSLSDAMKATGTLYAMEVETSARIKADTMKDEEAKKKK